MLYPVVEDSGRRAEPRVPGAARKGAKRGMARRAPAGYDRQCTVKQQTVSCDLEGSRSVRMQRPIHLDVHL
jgi:hypothetical protein